jgi:hypothetical protein
MAYHWKIISLIIHLKFNKYLLKYYYWHLSDIWLSLQGISYISLKCQRSFQTVYEFRAILCKMLDGSYQVHIFQFYICTYALKITYQEKRKKIIMYCIPKVHFY